MFETRLVSKVVKNKHTRIKVKLTYEKQFDNLINIFVSTIENAKSIVPNDVFSIGAFDYYVHLKSEKTGELLVLDFDSLEDKLTNNLSYTLKIMQNIVMVSKIVNASPLNIKFDDTFFHANSLDLNDFVVVRRLSEDNKSLFELTDLSPFSDDNNVDLIYKFLPDKMTLFSSLPFSDNLMVHYHKNQIDLVNENDEIVYTTKC